MITDLRNLNYAIENKENAFIHCDAMDAMRMMPDKCIDLAIVDPVYGDVTKGGYMSHKGGEKYKNSCAHEIEYDNTLWEQAKTPPEYFKELFRVSKNQVIWGGNYFTECLPNSQGWIVWDKEKAEGVTFADCELAFTSYNRATRICRFMWNGMLQGDMKNKENKIHPCQKPVKVYEWVINNYAKPGDLIMDTHVGSASSLVACRNTNHPFIGFEIHDGYYHKAKERIEAELAQTNIFDFLGG